MPSTQELAASLGWGTETGGRNESIQHTRETFWSTDPNYNQGRSMCLHLCGYEQDLETGDLLENEDPGHELIPCGGDPNKNTAWESEDNQTLTSQNKNPKRMFNEKSAMGLFIDRIVNENNPNYIAGFLEALIERHGKPNMFDAATYNNVILHWKRFDGEPFTTADGKTAKSSRLLPVKFLGWSDGWKPTKNGKSAPAAKAASAKAVKAAPAKADDTEAGGANDDAINALLETLSKATKAKLKTYADKAKNTDEFFDKAVELDEVTDEHRLVEYAGNGELYELLKRQ